VLGEVEVPEPLLLEEDGVWLEEDEEFDPLDEIEESLVSEVEPEVEELVVPRDD